MKKILAAVGLFLLAAMAHANYAFVKTGQNSANLNVITFSPTNTGDLLILVTGTSNGGGTPTVTSVVDNNLVAWTSAVATVNTTFAPTAWQTIYYLPNCEAGITAVTVTYNGGTPGTTAILIAEYSGISTTSPFGVTVHNSQATPGTAANALTSTAATVPAAPSLVFGLTFNQGDSDTVAGTGYTARLLGDNVFFIEDKRVTSTGSNTVTATAPTHGAGDSYTTYLLSFKEPAVASPSKMMLLFR